MKSIKKEKAPKIKTPLQKEIFKIKQDFITRNFEKEKINWPRELKIINNLFELVDDLEFWKVFNLYQKFNCALWFQKDSGRAYILQQYEKWLRAKQNDKLILVNKEEKVYNLEERKIGSDFESIVKPRSLKDFLNEN